MTADDFGLELSTRFMGRNLEYFATIDSTNRYLKDRLLIENVPLGAAVISDQQTEGRGRLGRSWWSPPEAGLYSSFIVYPGSRLSGVLSLLAAVALSEAVEAEVGLKPDLKWPNDVLLNRRKCSGILVESGTIPQPWAVIGIGVNVNGGLPDALGEGTTLAAEAGRNVSRIRLWAELAKRLEWWYEAWLSRGQKPVLDGWRLRSITLHQPVEIIQAGRLLFTGRAEDVDDEGALLVLRDGGQLERVVSGEVSLRYPGGRYHPG